MGLRFGSGLVVGVGARLRERGEHPAAPPKLSPPASSTRDRSGMGQRARCSVRSAQPGRSSGSARRGTLSAVKPKPSEW